MNSDEDWGLSAQSNCNFIEGADLAGGDVMPPGEVAESSAARLALRLFIGGGEISMVISKPMHERIPNTSLLRIYRKESGSECMLKGGEIEPPERS